VVEEYEEEYNKKMKIWEKGLEEFGVNESRETFTEGSDQDVFAEWERSIDRLAGIERPEKRKEGNTKKLHEVINFLKKKKFPESKEVYGKKEEPFLHGQMHVLLVDKFGLDNVKKEETINEGRKRIDFAVFDVGIEVKIFRSTKDFDRLLQEVYYYTQVYKQIIVPYINLGGVEPPKLKQLLERLKKRNPEVKDYFELKTGSKKD